MKRILYIAIALLVGFAVFQGCIQKTAETNNLVFSQGTSYATMVPILENSEEPIIFEDPGFEELIREILHKPTGDISQSDLDSIEKLAIEENEFVAVNEDVESWKYGLEDFRRKPIRDKKGFDFEGNNQISYSDIGKLRNLNTLILWNCGLESVEPFKPLKQLTYLDLDENLIIDIEPLMGLQKLEILVLDDNKVTFLPSLNQLIYLQKFSIHNNDIVAYEEKLNCPALIVLNISYNRQLSDISFIEGLSNLEVLDIGGTSIKNIDCVSNLISLRKLFIAEMEITDLDGLANLTNLRTLDLDATMVKNTDALINLSDLEVLDFFYKDEADITVLLGLKNLKELSIESNSENISEILETVFSLGTLEMLDLNLWGIESIDGIENLSRLKELSVGVRPDLSAADALVPLASLEHLDKLQLRYCDITDLTPLLSLPNLKILDISGNPIEDYSVLDQLDLDKLYK